jgi:hypothetical protein
LCERRRGKKGSTRGSVHWGYYYATDIDIEFIRNAAALAAASTTLLFSDW